MKTSEKFISVLCGPAGEVCISGSKEDNNILSDAIREVILLEGKGEEAIVPISKDKVKEVFGTIEMVKAIETLEYHDQNHLRGTVEMRSRVKTSLLTEVLCSLSDCL